MNLENVSTIELVDKVLPFFNDHDFTNLYDPFLAIGFTESDLTGPKQRLMYDTLSVLKNSLEYVFPYGDSGQYFLLTQLGREVKISGGHFAYLNKIVERESINNLRLERKDKADKLDLQIKEWQVRTKYFPYIVSILALTVSIISYFKPEKKQADLQQVQQDLQKLQERVRLQDSLFRVDTLLKKRI